MHTKLIRLVGVLLAVCCTYPAYRELHRALCGTPDLCLQHAEAHPFLEKLPAKQITLPGKPIVKILRQAGFQGDQLELAYAVMKAESGGRPEAFNGNHQTGDQSYGIFQINMLGRLGAARRKQFHLASNDDLYDPLTNARVAYAISGGGTNWRPWGAFSNGSYKRHLSEL